MSGAEMIAAERQRQIEVEGWTPQHDAEHDRGELLEAAICYAHVARLDILPTFPPNDHMITWPWDDDSWRPSTDHVRDLAKAGALIAAEIDRIEAAR